MAMDASLYFKNAWCMKVTGTPSMMQKISWRCDDYHANTIILNQAMGYVLSEKTECVATLVGGYCTSTFSSNFLIAFQNVHTREN